MRELEFLPEDYLRARLQRRIGFIRSWLLLALGLAMVLWSLQVGVWVRDARAELQALRGTGSAVDADVAKIKRLRTEAQSYNRRLELLKVLRPRILAADVVATLADLLPEGVVLDEINLNHPEVLGRDAAVLRVTGHAVSETMVAQAVSALEASPLLEKVVMMESKPLAGDVSRRAFVIEAKVVALTKE